MQELTDSELVKKYIGGEDQALNQLIERYFRQIFLFAKTYVKSDQEAEDVTQEVFVKLWKNVKKYNPEKKFKTWLFQITKNTCIDFLRKRKDMLPAESLEEEQMLATLESITDKSPLPEELLDAEGFSRELEKTLNTLPKIQSQTVTLHLQQDLNFQEIAEVLNEPLNTVKSRYRRALLAIRQTLGKKPT